MKPGSEQAIAIRNAVKTHKHQVPEETANWVIEHLTIEHNHREPLAARDPNARTISTPTTRKILRDPRHNRAVAVTLAPSKPILRKHELQKNLLTPKQLRLREGHCDIINR